MLQVELDWLLDDAVADYDGSTSTPGRISAWRVLKDAQREGPALETGKAVLRVSLDALTRLWRRRISERCSSALPYLPGLHHNDDNPLVAISELFCVSGCPFSI